MKATVRGSRTFRFRETNHDSWDWTSSCTTVSTLPKYFHPAPVSVTCVSRGWSKKTWECKLLHWQAVKRQTYDNTASYAQYTRVTSNLLCSQYRRDACIKSCDILWLSYVEEILGKSNLVKTICLNTISLEMLSSMCHLFCKLDCYFDFAPTACLHIEGFMNRKRTFWCQPQKEASRKLGQRIIKTSQIRASSNRTSLIVCWRWYSNMFRAWIENWQPSLLTRIKTSVLTEHWRAPR